MGAVVAAIADGTDRDRHLPAARSPVPTKSIGRGTGLGLSITYGIVREHEGTIHCDSAVGQGTRFILSLPMAATEMRSVRR